MAIQNYADNGAFAPRKIVDALRTTSDELARSLGLGKDAIQRKDRIASDRTQRRLRQSWKRSTRSCSVWAVVPSLVMAPGLPQS